jgi:hypothetical protein
MIPTPFVFGQIGSSPSIVIPARWEILGKEAKVVLLHELSHILNKDTVFTTGAGFLIPRLRFLLLLALPLALAIGFRAESAGLLAYLSLLYAYCAISFFVLFCAISRGREMLADITVAQFAGTAEASSSLLEVDLEKALSAHSNFPHTDMGSGRYFQRAERWLNDKALFGKARAFWGGVRRVLVYLFSGKSEHRVRTHDLLDAIRVARTEPVPTKESAFWTGFAVSTFLALLFIGCQIWEKMVAGSETGYALKYLMDIAYVLSFPLFALVTCVFALPAWSQQSMAGFSAKYLLSLIRRHEFFLLGALMGFVLLIGFPYTAIERAVAVIAHAILVAFVISLSGLMTVMSVLVYHRFPRGARRLWRDLAGLAICSALGVLLSAVSVVFGAWLALSEEYAEGWGVIGGVFGGFYGLLLGAKGVFSRDDKYLVATFPWTNRFKRIELNRGSLIRANLMYLASVMVVGVPTGVVVYLGVRYLLVPDYWWVAGFALAGAVALFGFLSATSQGLSFSSEQRGSASDLCKTLTLLELAPSQELGEAISEVWQWWGSNLLEDRRGDRWESRTCRQLCEMGTIVAWGRTGPVQKAHVVSSILGCEWADGGFGIWPGSRPRLSMTYLALETFQSLGCLDKASDETHVSWVQGLRKDGVFRDPLARREPWEDTFFAIKSLALMGKLELGDDHDIVRTLEKSLWQAVQKGDMEAVWYCVESLSVLGHNEKRPPVEELLRRTAFNLSIANPIYAARTIRSVIEAARIVLPSPDDVAALFPDDFPDRLMSAMEKELEPVVKRLRRKTARNKS